MATVLEISDSTTTIALNMDVGMSGFKLHGLEDAWNPVIPFYKGGGTWQQSPLAPGRQLVDRQFENVIDTFRIHMEGTSQDDAIENTQNLRRMLEKAANYWTTDWQNTPVYIKAKATNETYSRYAIIYTGRIATDGNPYACRFNNGVGADNPAWMWDLSLVIEHGHWTENAPGTSTAVEISAVEEYDGRALGNVDASGDRDPTTDNEVYVSSKRNVANLSDIYVDDGGAFGANLLDAALPYSLLPAVPAVNDALYFGIDTTLTDSGPFCSLVFDIGTAGAGYTDAWEYWNGAWVALTVQDNTNASGAGTGIAFDTTGVNSVHWIQPSDWATTAVNGATGYWVRMRVSAIPGALTAPTQQNRNIYSIVWPYTEIDDSQALGDITAQQRTKVYSQSAAPSAGAPKMDFNRLIVGLRSISRGQNFTPYINCANEQNPAGITATASGGAFTADTTTPSGVRYTVTVGGGGGSGGIRLSFDNTIAAEFYGTYHIFVRGKLHAGTATTVSNRITFRVGNSSTNIDTIYASDYVYFSSTNDWQILDFGKITIPGTMISTTNIFTLFDLLLLAEDSASAFTVYYYDMILIPVDEWAGDFFSDSLAFEVSIGQFLDYNNITYLKKKPGIVNSRNTSTGCYGAPYTSISNGEFVIQANVTQRQYFLFGRLNNTNDWRWEPYISASIQTERNARYLSMRGDR